MTTPETYSAHDQFEDVPNRMREPLAVSTLPAAETAGGERVAFEAWAKANALATAGSDDPDYGPFSHTAAAWKAWKARASLPSTGRDGGGAVALIIKLGEALAQVCGDDNYYNKYAHEAYEAYEEYRLAAPGAALPAVGHSDPNDEKRRVESEREVDFYTVAMAAHAAWRDCLVEEGRGPAWADLSVSQHLQWMNAVEAVLSLQPSQPATVVPVGVPAGWQIQPDEEGTRVVSPSGDACYLWDLDSRHAEAGQCHREVLRQLCQDLLFSAPRAPAESGWQPIATAPKNTPIRLYAQGGGFYDEDFNPSGSVEGQWTDGTWCGAFWDPVHDTWFRRDDIVPTHWQPLPAAPSAAQPGGEGGAT